MEQIKRFCDVLHEKRVACRLTLREFCRRAEEDPANFSRIERGLRTPPSDEVLSRYAKALGLDGEEARDFVTLGVISRRELPKDIPLEKLVDKLPAMLRAIDGEKPTDEQLSNAIDMTEKVFRP